MRVDLNTGEQIFEVAMDGVVGAALVGLEQIFAGLVGDSAMGAAPVAPARAPER